MLVSLLQLVVAVRGSCSCIYTTGSTIQQLPPVRETDTDYTSNKPAPWTHSSSASNTDSASSPASRPPLPSGTAAVRSKPECSTGTLNVPVSFVRRQIQNFCADDELLSSMIAPPINGLTHEPTLKWALGWTIENGGKTLFLDVAYTRRVCRGAVPLAEGRTSEDKREYCRASCESILGGCGVHNGGALYDGCRVYMINFGRHSQTKGWFKDEGVVICDDTNHVRDRPILSRDTCTCWYSGYPGLTALFERPASGSCVVDEIFEDH